MQVKSSLKQANKQRTPPQAELAERNCPRFAPGGKQIEGSLSMRSGELDAKAEVSVKKPILPVTPAARSSRPPALKATSTSPSLGCALEERLTQLSPPVPATQPQEVPRHRLARFQHGGPRSSRHPIQADSLRPSRQGGPYSTSPFPLTSAKLGLPFPPRPAPSSWRRKILLLRPTEP